MREQIWKVVTILACLLLAALFWWDRTDAGRQREQFKLAAAKAQPLLAEQEDLRRKLAELELVKSGAQGGTPSLELLFAEPTDALVDTVEPYMKEQSFTGVLALSLEQLSGEKPMVSDSRISELLEEGWSWCFYDTGDQQLDFASWFGNAAVLAADHGLESASAVYFAANAYTSAYDEPLKGAGIPTVIHHGEDGLSLLADSLENGDTLWKAGACSWNGEQTRALLGSAISQRKNLVYVVDPDTDGEFDETQFQSMLKTLKEYETLDGLVVSGLEQARTPQSADASAEGTDAAQTVNTPVGGTDSALQGGKQQTEQQKQQAELKDQIARLEEEIKDLYRRN